MRRAGNEKKMSERVAWGRGERCWG